MYTYVPECGRLTCKQSEWGLGMPQPVCALRGRGEGVLAVLPLITVCGLSSLFTTQEVYPELSKHFQSVVSSMTFNPCMQTPTSPVEACMCSRDLSTLFKMCGCLPSPPRASAPQCMPRPGLSLCLPPRCPSMWSTESWMPS